MTRPAALGGRPAFPDGLAFARPFRPAYQDVVDRLAPSYEAGQLTNGPLVQQLEDGARTRLGVEHAVAVASCTAGLMLLIRVLDPDGDVALPSFTFSASALAVVWNGRRPGFVECRDDTFQVDVDDLGERLGGAGMVMATHVFGAPCAAGEVEEAGRAAGLPVIFDAAHAFGARHRGRPVGGFGDAEVFSLSPTKVVVAGEGGIVATNRSDLADALRMGRDYGKGSDYDTVFPGLNARMSELHAAMALESLARLDEHLAVRSRYAEAYRAGFEGIDGLRLQSVPDDDVSTWKDLTVAVDVDEFGTTRDVLVSALRAEGIDTRCYFDPPVHRHQAYAPPEGVSLPRTDAVASSVVSLPLYADLDASTIDGITAAVRDIAHHAAQLDAAAGQR